MARLLFQVAHGTLSDGALDAVETQKELLGASGLMLLLAPRVKSEDAAEEDVYWLSALLQLKQLLQAKPFQPALPLVVLVPGSGGDAMAKDVEDGSWRRLVYSPAANGLSPGCAEVLAVRGRSWASGRCGDWKQGWVGSVP